MIYSFIFFSVIFFSYSLAQAGVKMGNRKTLSISVPIFISCLIIILFLGTRYNVGRDFIGHWQDYKYLNENDFGYLHRYQMEYGYLYTVKLAQFLPFGAQGIFLITSFITGILFFRLYKTYPRFLPLGIVCFFLCGPYEFEINGIRQGIAILCFLNACTYLNDSVSWKKSVLPYVLWILFGMLFHTSCAAMIAFFLLRFVNVDNHFVRVGLIIAPIIAYLLNITGVVTSLFDFSALEFENSNYNSYLSGDKADYIKVASDGLNLGQFAIFFTSMIPLYYSRLICERFPNIKVFVLIYAIGLSLSSLFIGNMMVTRLAYYFTFSLLLIYPAFTYCFNKTRELTTNMLLYYIFWMWFIVQYIYTLPNFFKLHVWPGASVFGIGI